MEVLAERGGDVLYHDDHVPALPELGLANQPLDDSVLERADAVVLVTAHPGIDYVAIAERCRLFIDLRGVTRGLHAANLVRL
jgi:UDP-N-acetyl-D-glucosamine dehydrogenase